MLRRFQQAARSLAAGDGDVESYCTQRKRSAHYFVERASILKAYIFLATILKMSLAVNPGDINECHGEVLHLSLIIHQIHFSTIIKRTIIILMPGLNNRNKCLESFVVPQIPVYPIYCVETIDPHTHLLYSRFTMALNLLFPAHEMIKFCRSIIVSN